MIDPIEPAHNDEDQAAERFRASEDRFRLIADNVGDVIWTAELPPLETGADWTSADKAELAGRVLDHWRFSFVNAAAERVFGYTPAETVDLSLRDIAAPATMAQVRQALIEDFSRDVSNPASATPQRFLELEFRAKDGSPRWCEVLSTYIRDTRGVPTAVLGISRDVTARRQTERALRQSEATLRGLFENLPDFVVLVDRDARIHLANRGQPGVSRESLQGTSGFGWIAPEYQQVVRDALRQAIAAGVPQTVTVQDVFGQWWVSRVAPFGDEDDAKHAMVICTDVTQERLAAEAVKKEQRLLRQLLELHERERQLIAYEIHDGFAQQLTGALYRLQGFRETLARDPVRAWQDFDSAARLLARAIDEARRLISGLRPPILDESGIVEAIEYLIYERRKEGGPAIEFDHDVACQHLAPPLENAVFRIVQESLTNACRHGRSDRIRVELVERDGRIHIDVRDWGVGFDPNAVTERQFGLQGIRERVRLLDGRVTIESAPNEGTHIAVELPMTSGA
jgi:PAS domain S-box-containing protein